MKQRRGRNEKIYVRHRVSNLIINGLADGLPVNGNTLQRAQPVADTKNIHAHLECFRTERQRCKRHVTTIACAHDANELMAAVTETRQKGLRFHPVPQGLPSVLAAGRDEKVLNITGASAVTDTH